MGTARRTAEAFLMIDPGWSTPLARWEAIKTLASAGADGLRQWGIGEAHLFTHDPRFARRLQKLTGGLNVHPDNRIHLCMMLWEDADGIADR